MLPSSALHSAVMLYSTGVLLLPTFCTYASDQSRVINPRSITMMASTALTSASVPYACTVRTSRGFFSKVADANASAPNSEAANPTISAE